ncbi:MAG: C10 family peptidase [Candidatus Eisenbacteria bacterium]|uniref:C10 family peptidase n=1 Tax=Eiseniibacteriota bacterium TaxID=2212470 RepID=A0A937X9G7_UNCEI|nr:C10 family peptidase [Candidatus Eisenbacteria bacterium]
MARRDLRIVLLLIACPCLFSLPVRAEPVAGLAARRIAAAFLERIRAAGFEASGAFAVPGEREPLAHVVTLDPAGYVVVAADDRLPPVIAYSTTAEYPGGEEIPDPLLALLQADLERRLAALPQLDARAAEARSQAWSELAAGTSRRGARFEQWPPEGSTPTGGWIAANWAQGAPYNALCPLDLAHGGSRSLAGCPAVAMAMILNYHETIQGTAFDGGDRYWHNYAGNAYWIPDAHAQYGFPSFATLNGYLETLTQHWAEGTPLTNTDKAALVFGCGVAARQVYSASGSGTFGVGQAFDAFRRFAFADCRLVFDTDPDLYPDMAAQMQNALPVHLAVVDPDWTMGHNLVVDGYNTDSYFHLNFGWGGAYNGWYLLPQEIPYGLTVIEGAILDIVPESQSGAHLPAGGAALALAGGPNPIGPRLTLTFASPAAGRARLGIYDAAGRRQELLLDAEIPEGTRSFDWTPRRLESGVYWARLQIGDRVATRRLVLAR